MTCSSQIRVILTLLVCLLPRIGFASYEEDLRRAESNLDDLGLPAGCSAIKDLLDSVIAEAPVGTRAWQNGIILQSNCFRMQGRYTDSVALLTEGLNRRPEDRRLGGMLGIVQAEQGRYSEAIPLLRDAMAVSPTKTVKDSLALALFGVAAPSLLPERVLERNSLLTEAATLLDGLVKAAETTPEKAGYRMRLAQVLNAQGKSGSALELAAAALRESEGKVSQGLEAEFNMTYGQMCYANGRRAEGLLHMDRALTLAPTPEFKRALTLLKDGTTGSVAGANQDEPLFQRGDRVVIPGD